MYIKFLNIVISNAGCFELELARSWTELSNEHENNATAGTTHIAFNYLFTSIRTSYGWILDLTPIGSQSDVMVWLRM